MFPFLTLFSYTMCIKWSQKRFNGDLRDFLMLDDSLLVFAECLLETILEGFTMVCFLGSCDEKGGWIDKKIG